MKIILDLSPGQAKLLESVTYQHWERLHDEVGDNQPETQIASSLVDLVKEAIPTKPE